MLLGDQGFLILVVATKHISRRRQQPTQPDQTSFANLRVHRINARQRLILQVVSIILSVELGRQKSNKLNFC